MVYGASLTVSGEFLLNTKSEPDVKRDICSKVKMIIVLIRFLLKEKKEKKEKREDIDDPDPLAKNSSDEESTSNMDGNNENE
ncbi:Hypothetical predicted protein [Octopus vulgaris]|uniref:Uncharacterized protein n=1 Tax=Octopus vulgaris TaxID=6645 RepID=A0AA36AIU6_OCTVU|nr:Hypothetical predicted protein [Octopus vulgaris]